jgi:hypothetical protein
MCQKKKLAILCVSTSTNIIHRENLNDTGFNFINKFAIVTGMTLNNVLPSVKQIVQGTEDFVPLLYVIGTKDKQGTMLNSLTGKKPYEKELVFESTGALVASGYDLGSLTHLYFVSKRSAFSSDDPKEKELLHVTLLPVKKNTQQNFVYEIRKDSKGNVSFALLENIEIHDPWANDFLLPAFGCHPELCVKVGRKQASRDAREVQPIPGIGQGRERPPDLQKASPEKAVKSGKETLRMAGTPQESEHKPPPPEPPFTAGCWRPDGFPFSNSLTPRCCASGCPGWWPRQSSGNWSPW